MSIADFQVVHEALFGASLALLRGEIRATASGCEPEDIPLDLQVDEAVGDVLSATAGAVTPQGFQYRRANVIESPVRIDRLAATAIVGKRTPSPFGQR